jgi:hypothetical protein
MDKNPEDEIVITALLERFNNQRLPRARSMEKKVFAGEKLNAQELAYLETVLNDAQYILRLTDKYPEYQEIVSKAIQLYMNITEKALENENNNNK